MNHLSFQLDITDVDATEDELPHRAVEVTPLIDGVLLKCAVFDAMAVVTHHLADGDFDIFTCSCGVAGCAGIFEEAKLRVTAETVSWQFPEEPFRKSFTPKLLAADQPLLVTFEKAQYECAINQLWAQLLALEAEGPFPVVVLPDSWPDLEKSLDAQLEASRVGLASWQARLAKAREIFGPLNDAVVRIMLATGTEYRMYLTTLAREAVALHTAIPFDNEKGVEDRVLKEIVVPSFAADVKNIGEAARALPFKVVRPFTWLAAGPATEPLTEDGLASATFALCVED